MIPPHKLKELPYSQGLRKTAKIFEEAERRCLLKPGLSKDEIVYLTDILSLWINRVPEKLGKALIEIRDNLETNGLWRSLKTVCHLLRSETGQFPSDWDFHAADSGGLNQEKRRIFPGMEVYLEDIRSPFNVGAIFRCAESFGAEKIYLSPFCADPNHPRAKRTAMGCVSVLPWLRLEEDPFMNMPNSTESFPHCTAFFALETGGTKLEDFPFPSRGVMIIGSEELGVSPKALARADSSLGRVSIPIFGAKGSLNVSVAFGIVMHAWAGVLQK
ncbi:MAG: TrmH family RNA methyltransferase [Treponema sp.]|nr:TrmH family RNA methyltransferase [Treponema sp.]